MSENGNSAKAASADAAEMRQMIMGFRNTQLLYVAATLGIPDMLQKESKTADELADTLRCHAGTLFRLMRALACIDILVYKADGTFSLAAKGHLLRSDVNGSLKNIAMLYGEPWLWSSYGRMIETVRTGETAFDIVHGKSLYYFLSGNSAAHETFNRAMSGFSDIEAAAIIDVYDFSGAASVVDIGGGHGHLVHALLKSFPRVPMVLFDLPQVIDTLSSFETNRVRLVRGDFFADELPREDVYVLKSIIHNWPDEMAVKILRNCRTSMQARSKLLIIERLINDKKEFDETTLFDINMMTVAGGRERTVADYNNLIRKAGLQLHRVIETNCYLSIIEVIIL